MIEFTGNFVSDFQNSLLVWFSKHGRDFPWRKTEDPYSILVVEKLLQQTAIRAGFIDIYFSFLEAYPALQDLAVADGQQLRLLIEPLGLQYRAEELIRMAQEILDRYGGVIPADLESLLSIYGIGDYSARAVLCFAYGKDIPVVDTNISRILYRVLDIPGKIPSNPARNRNLINIMERLVPSGRANYFNWGMIDHGAMICKPKTPLCKECPINHLCKYFQKLVDNK